MHLARSTQSTLVATALLTATHAQASPVIFGTYYDETPPPVLTTCQSTYVCSLYFSQLPSDKLLMVTKLICGFVSQGRVLEAQLFVAQGSGASGTLPRHLVLPIPAAPVASPSNGYFYTTVEMAPQWLVGQGRFPYIQLFTTAIGSITMDCTIRGELVDPLQ